MDTRDHQQLEIDGKAVSKRAYRKPSVQVYGTLSEMTQAAGNPDGHKAENPGAPGPSQNNNRT